MNHSTRSLNQYEIAYANSVFERVQADYRKRIQVSFLNTINSSRILEIGCGYEPISTVFSDFKELFIVEPGKKFAAEARKIAEHDCRITVIEDSIEESVESLSGRRFDAILLSGLLHEVHDCELLMGIVACICDTTTAVHVNVPNAKSLHRLIALEMDLISSVYERSDTQIALQQNHTFDIDSLIALCEGKGFLVVESGSYLIKPFTHKQMAYLLDIGFIQPDFIEGLFGLEKHLPGFGSEIYVNLKIKK
jgi:hypothetical protein